MKKYNCFLPVLIWCIILNPLIAQGPKDYPSDPNCKDFITELKNGNLVIKEYIGAKPFLNIPSRINNIEVVEIEEYAFHRCQSLKEINFPKELKKIGDHAFQLCDSLQSVNFQSLELTIGTAAFAECHSLKELTLPEGTDTICDYAFFNCKQLTKVTVLDTDVIFSKQSDSCNIFNKENGKVSNSFIGYRGSSTEHLASQMNYIFTPIRANATETSLNTESVSSFMIYPTIVRSYINISINSPDIGGLLCIYSINGELVLEQKLLQTQTRVDLKRLAINKGLYVASFSSNNCRQVQKFVIR